MIYELQQRINRKDEEYMKLVEKNGHTFAVGMLWQIPDEGKKLPNLQRISKDTGNDMYCVIDSLRPTFGFAHKSELQGHKHVASLGKFIVETSQLSANYANSIICYKFKSAGELDENHQELNSDQYGYIVILNGTICPCDGEYVADCAAVKNSIIEKAMLHPIEAMYLTCDVASNFLHIFARLNHALGNENVLLQIIQEETPKRLVLLYDFIHDKQLTLKSNLDAAAYQNFLQKLDLRIENRNVEFDLTDIKILTIIVSSLEFVQALKDIYADDADKNLHYLIANVIQIPYTSDMLYWQSPHFKHNVSKAYLKSLYDLTTRKYKLALLMLVITLCSYVIYTVLHKLKSAKPVVHAALLPHSNLVPANDLLAKCLKPNDRFFRDLNPWTFTQLHCDSLHATLTFVSSSDTSISNFIQLVGESQNILFNGHIGTLIRHYHIYVPIAVARKESNTVINSQLASKNSNRIQRTKLPIVSKMPQQVELVNNLQQASTQYAFALNLQHSIKATTKHIPIQFSIISTVSPLYLNEHGVFDHLLLKTIDMHFDVVSGFYKWKIVGVVP